MPFNPGPYLRCILNTYRVHSNPAKVLWNVFAIIQGAPYVLDHPETSMIENVKIKAGQE